jgi:DNA-binding XRE family transcriptional regulator/desulfoferrodoxin (superoxide reductase-like protein)
MDCGKVGALLLRLRGEKSMTQKQVADHLNMSDKTVSKWERGLGCPDVNVLGELSALFGVNIEQILAGDIRLNRQESGNLARVRFYDCPFCGNVIHATGNPEISCCGRKLPPLTAKPADEAHAAAVEDSDGAYYVTFAHEMRKEHYISFVAYVANDRLLLVKLYPEQDAAVILPKMGAGGLLRKNSRRLYYYCTEHGLFTL